MSIMIVMAQDCFLLTMSRRLPGYSVHFVGFPQEVSVYFFGGSYHMTVRKLTRTLEPDNKASSTDMATDQA